MRFNKRKIFVCVSGVIFAFVCLELFLRLFGFFYQNPLSLPDTKDLNNDSYVIVCLGDSFTYGLGASPKMSYPKQLQKIFDEEYPHRTIKVLNHGMPGSNTTHIRKRFEKIISQFHPDLVLYLAGSSNHWNLEHYDEFLGDNSFTARLVNHLYNIRVFKLIKLLSHNIVNFMNDYFLRNKRVSSPSKNGSKKEQYFRKMGNYEKAIMWYKEGIAGDPKFLDNYLGLAWTYYMMHEQEKALDLFFKVYEKDPHNIRALLGIGHIYKDLKEYEKAEEWFDRALSIEPENPKIYRNMAWTYLERGNPEEALEWYEKGITVDPLYDDNYYGALQLYRTLDKRARGIELLRSFSARNPQCRYFIDALEENDVFFENIEQWIISDTERIISLCVNNDISLMMQTFPYKDENIDLNTVFQQLALKHSIPIIDHYARFEDLRKSSEDIREYLLPDYHCNDKGYAVIAQTIFEEIENTEILSEINRNSRMTAEPIS